MSQFNNKTSLNLEKSIPKSFSMSPECRSLRANDESVDIDQCSEDGLDTSKLSRSSPMNNYHPTTATREHNHSPPTSDNIPTSRVMKKKGSRDEKMRMRSKCNCDELRHIECCLETKDLWDKFHDLETEMIITKTGR